MNAASKETMMSSNQTTKMFTYEFPDVDSDLSIFPVPEEDVLGVEHFLEPDFNKCFSGSVLDFNTFHSHKCLSIDNFSFAVEFDQIKIDSESLHSSLTLEGERIKQEDHDGKLQGTNDVVCSGINKLPVNVNSQTADDIFNLAPGSCNASFLGNVDFGSYSQGFCTTDIGVDLSFAGVLVPQPIYDQNSHFPSDIQLKNSLTVAGHDVAFDHNEGKLMISSSTGSSGCSGSSTVCLDDENMSDDRPVKRKRLSSCGSSKTTSEHNESKIIPFNEGNKVDTHVTEKRLRKPPRRYSEESIEQKSRSNLKKSAHKGSKDKSFPSESHKHHWQKKLKPAPIVHKDKSFNGGCIQVPFGLPIEEGHVVKKKTCWEAEEIKDNGILCIKDKNDMESFSAESEDENTEDECITKGNTQKGSSRRKHHISWTLSEVMKLVEGVSEYGVGRWTEIKRLQFSSSSHRTSVDLKDKWRNLLKASDTQLQNRRKVVLGRKQASQQVPESVLCRVRELAAIYPYPRENKSKESCSAPSTSSFKSTTSNMFVSLPTVV